MPTATPSWQLDGTMRLEQSTSLPMLEGHVTAGQQGLKDRQVLKEKASKDRDPSLYGEL